MSLRLERLTGVTILLTALAVVLGALLGDPTIESQDDREKFVEQVENAADRIPVIYAFQVVEVASGFLTIAAGLGLYLLLRERARLPALAGLLLFVVSCVFEAGRAFVGAAMVRAADDYTGWRAGGDRQRQRRRARAHPRPRGRPLRVLPDGVRSARNRGRRLRLRPRLVDRLRAALAGLARACRGRTARLHAAGRDRGRHLLPILLRDDLHARL